MKKEKITWIIVLLFVICLSGLQAQTSLNVKDKSGTQTSFLLSSLNKLVFTAGNMTVDKKDGSSDDFVLVNIRNLNFSNTTAIDQVNSTGTNMLLYPNPVTDRLQVRYESVTEENVQVQLIDIQGRVLYQQNIKSQQGTNYVNIPVGSFQNGLYLCKLQKGNNIEISKFIKY